VRDHGVRIVDPRVADAAGKQRGKHIRIIAAAAADLEQPRVCKARRSYGFRRDLEIETGFAALHGGDHVPISALLSRHSARGKPSARRDAEVARFLKAAEHAIIGRTENVTPQKRRCLDDALADLPDETGKLHRGARESSTNPRISVARWR
jgi:hypothetical protein